MNVCWFRGYRFMTSKLVSLHLFLFLLLGNTISVNAEPMSVNLERNDSNLGNISGNTLDSGLDKTVEPKTVFDAVVRQLEQNEKATVSNAVVSEGNKEREIATTISLALSKTVSEAVVEDTAERLAREIAELVSTGLESSVDEIAVDQVAKNSVSEKIASRQLEGEKSKRQTNVVQKVTKEKSKLTQGERLTANFIMRTQQGKANKGSGWVYLGHFVRNDWLSKTLDIKKTLPKIGRNYTVMHSLNMRVEAPTNSGTAQLIKKLEKDDSVKILKVRPSGRNGHYWAQVEYQ